MWRSDLIKIMTTMMVMMRIIHLVESADTNLIFSPCEDAEVRKGDGFTFGIAFSTKESFFQDQIQLSPCDSLLGLAGKNAQLALFRPKIDEISLLTINGTEFTPMAAVGYMVAFAGAKYAARSSPLKVADNTHTITSFTLVLEFEKGKLQNLHWKSFGCNSCKGGSSVCLNDADCAVPTSNCKGGAGGGTVDCSLGIQLAFSGTDKNLEALNTWYEVSNLRQYSLYKLYSDAVGAVV